MEIVHEVVGRVFAEMFWVLYHWMVCLCLSMTFDWEGYLPKAMMVKVRIWLIEEMRLFLRIPEQIEEIDLKNIKERYSWGRCLR